MPPRPLRVWGVFVFFFHSAGGGLPGGAGGQGVPSGWVPRKHPWGAAPRGPACPAGVPISPEKWGERGPGLRPWTPGFRAARSHSLVFRLIVSDTAEGRFPPIFQNRFGPHFREKICWKAFLRKEVPKSGYRHGCRTSPSTGTMRPTTPKRASGNERAIKKGVQGACPRHSFLRLSPAKAGLPPGVGRETTSQVWTCAGPDGTTCRHPSKNLPSPLTRHRIMVIIHSQTVLS